MGTNIITTIINDRLRPIWCKILTIFISINAERRIIIIIIPPGPSSLKAPIAPNKNNGELIIKIIANCIKKLPATHFIRVLILALVIANPSLSNNMSPIATATIKINGNSSFLEMVPVCKKVNNILK